MRWYGWCGWRSADSVGLGGSDDLIGDQDLTGTRLPGNPGGEVHGAAEVVAVLDHGQPRVADQVEKADRRGLRDPLAHPGLLDRGLDVFHQIRDLLGYRAAR